MSGARPHFECSSWEHLQHKRTPPVFSLSSPLRLRVDSDRDPCDPRIPIRLSSRGGGVFESHARVRHVHTCTTACSRAENSEELTNGSRRQSALVKVKVYDSDSATCYRSASQALGPALPSVVVRTSTSLLGHRRLDPGDCHVRLAPQVQLPHKTGFYVTCSKPNIQITPELQLPWRMVDGMTGPGCCAVGYPLTTSHDEHKIACRRPVFCMVRTASVWLPSLRRFT